MLETIAPKVVPNIAALPILRLWLNGISESDNLIWNNAEKLSGPSNIVKAAYNAAITIDSVKVFLSKYIRLFLFFPIFYTPPNRGLLRGTVGGPPPATTIH